MTKALSLRHLAQLSHFLHKSKRWKGARFVFSWCGLSCRVCCRNQRWRPREISLLKVWWDSASQARYSTHNTIHFQTWFHSPAERLSQYLPFWQWRWICSELPWMTDRSGFGIFLLLTHVNVRGHTAFVGVSPANFGGKKTRPGPCCVWTRCTNAHSECSQSRTEPKNSRATWCLRVQIGGIACVVAFHFAHPRLPFHAKRLKVLKEPQAPGLWCRQLVRCPRNHSPIAVFMFSCVICLLTGFTMQIFRSCESLQELRWWVCLLHRKAKSVNLDKASLTNIRR